MAGPENARGRGDGAPGDEGAPTEEAPQAVMGEGGGGPGQQAPEGEGEPSSGEGGEGGEGGAVAQEEAPAQEEEGSGEAQDAQAGPGGGAGAAAAAPAAPPTPAAPAGAPAPDLGPTISDHALNVTLPSEPAIDQLVCDATGMSLSDHLSADQEILSQLDALGQDLQVDLDSQVTGVSLPAIDTTTTESQTALLSGGQDAVCLITDQATATDAQIDAAANQAAAGLDTAGDAAASTLQSTVDQATGGLASRYDEFVAQAETVQSTWQERLQARIQGAKQEIERYAEELAGAQETLGTEAVTAAESSGGSARGAGARRAAMAIAGAAKGSEKRTEYARSLRAYAQVAGAELERQADEGTVLSGRLLTPTIADARPQMRTHEAEMRTEASNRERELYHARRTAQQSLSDTAAEERAHLANQSTQAATHLSDATQQTDEQLQESRETLAISTSNVASDLNQSADEGYSGLHTAMDAVDGVIDSRELRTWGDSQVSILTSQRDAALDALASDQESATSQLDADAQVCVDETVTAAQDHAAAMGDSGQTISAALGTGATDAGASLDEAVQQTASGLSAVTDQATTALSDSGTTVSEESEAQLNRYDLIVQSYMNTAKGHLDSLVNYANTAAQSADASEQSTKGTDLSNRSDRAFEAIDGIGTDESKLRAAIFGVSAVEGRALEADYESNAGDYDSSRYSSYLRYDIYDDTSGSLYRGLIAALNGDRVTAAMELMQAPTDWGNTDAESILAELRQLNEEEREALLNNPEFPQIQQRVSMQMQMETGQLIGGANQWELDQFTALTDVSRSREEAHARADAVRLMEAYEGSILNPTDEATAFTVMGQYSERMGLLEQEFSSYASERRLTISGAEGVSQLTLHARDEMSDEELDRAEYLIAGDTAGARASGFQYHATEGEEQSAFSILENANMNAYTEASGDTAASGDYLAEMDARSEQSQMQDRWAENYAGTQVTVPSEQQYGQYDPYGGGGPQFEQQTANTMSDMIDLSFDHHGAASTDRREDDIMQQLLSEGRADSHLWLAYGIAGAGTREDYVKKAFSQMPTGEQGQDQLSTMRTYMRDNYGIDDLEEELGLGEHRGEWGAELSGQDAFEVDYRFQEIGGTANDVDQMYDLAMMVWEHYRDPAAYGGGMDALEAGEAAGNLTPLQEQLLEQYRVRRDEFDGNDGLLDGFTRSDELLDDHMRQLNALYEGRGSWTEMRDVGGRNSRQPLSATNATFLEFKALCDRVQRYGQIYNNQRQAILDAVTTVIQIVGAVLITAVTAGGGLTVVGGLLAGMALGALNIAITAAVLGPGYGYERFLTDLGKIVADAIVAIGTGGLGNRFPGLKKVLEDGLFKNYPIIMRAALTEAVAGLPGEVVNSLFDQRMWDSEDPAEAFAGAIAIGTVKNLATGIASGGTEALGEIQPQITAQTLTYIENVSTGVMGVLGDYNVMSGDDVGWQLLRAAGTGALSASLTNATARHVATRINSEGATADNISRLSEINGGARTLVLTHLDPAILAVLPDEVLAAQRDTSPQAENEQAAGG